LKHALYNRDSFGARRESDPPIVFFGRPEGLKRVEKFESRRMALPLESRPDKKRFQPYIDREKLNG
jgi:hypothetical protein